MNVKNGLTSLKVGAFYQLFFVKELRKALKGKPDRNLLSYS